MPYKCREHYKCYPKSEGNQASPSNNAVSLSAEENKISSFFVTHALYGSIFWSLGHAGRLTTESQDDDTAQPSHSLTPFRLGELFAWFQKNDQSNVKD